MMTSLRHDRRWWHHSILLRGLLTPWLVLSLMGAAPSQVYDIDLAAQDIADALNSLSEQTGVPVIFEYDLAQTRKSKAVSGRFTLTEALELLLRDSGLSGGLSSSGVITISPSITINATDRGKDMTSIPSTPDSRPPRRTRSFLKNLAAAISAALLTTSVAQSQEKTDEPANIMELVVVSAQKRDQNILDVAMSVSAFSDRDIEARGAIQLADFLLGAPSTAIIDNGSGDLNIAIRGISSTLGDSPVGYYLDEAPFSFINFVQVPDVRTWDLERVEVLRGPQGTLFGASSLGGTVRILTRNPVFNEFQGKLDLTASSTEDGGNNYGAKIALNIPLVDDTLALRIAATKEDYSGWLSFFDFFTFTVLEKVNDREIETLRAKLLWAPTEKMDFVLSFMSSDQESGSDTQAGDDGFILPFFLFPQSTESEWDLFALTFNYHAPSFDLVSATSYIDYDSAVRSPFTGQPSFSDSEIFSQEIRLNSSNSEGFRWTGGVYYRELTTDGSGNGAISNTTSDSWAVFGEVVWPFMDEKLDLTVGLRYYEDERTRDDKGFAFNPFTFGFLPVDVQADDTFSALSPRFNLAYHTDGGSLVYGNIAKGFRSGNIQSGASIAIADFAVTVPESPLFGLDPRSVVPIGIDEENAWTYELGTKAPFADGRIVIEAAVYYTDWTDLQTIINVTPVVGALVNVGSAHSLGIDFGLTAEPVDGLTLTASANWNESEYDEDFVDSGGSKVLTKGNRIINIPEFTVTGSAAYRWEFGSSGLSGFAMADVQYNTERTFSFGALVGESETMTQVSARIGLQGGHWGAFLYVQNLTNYDGRVSAPLPFPGIDTVAVRVRPRTIGINLKFNY